MFAGQRQDEIIRIVEKKGSVTLKELVDELGTSESTIRRDLTELDRNGALRKVFGGAVAIGSRKNATEESVARRMEVFAEEKQQIGRYAAALIEPNDFVYIDARAGTDPAGLPRQSDRRGAACHYGGCDRERCL